MARSRSHQLVATALAIFILISSPAFAAPLTNLFHTGVDDSGGLLSNEVVDPHYALIVSPDLSWPGPAAYVTAPAGPWVVNGPTSKWIAPSPDGGAAFRAVGYYTYRTQFNLTGYDPCTCVITGQWASDDETIDIYINGLSTSNTLSGLSTFDILHPLIITNGFVSGTNTVDFIVHNGGFQTGVRAELFGFAAVGEGTHMRITAIERADTNVLVSFTTCASKTYRVETNGDLVVSLWTTLTNNVPGTGGIVTITDTGAAVSPKRFYRVALTL